MADTPLILKRFNGSTYDKLHPETTWTQVLNKPSTFTPTAHTHDVDELNTTGTASASTFLRGDGQWAVPSYATGDITGVTAGNGLTGGGTSGTVTINAGAGTGISVAADSIAIASAYSPNTAIELTSAQNLNDITTAGFYYQTANADTSGNNYPSGEAGSLLVQKSAGLVTQTYTTYSTDPKVYVRTYYTSWSSWVRVFTDNYHPNADTLTTARTISLAGDVTGSVSFNGGSNVSITATVADDSHNHIIGNVDGLQTALNSKADDSAVVKLSGTQTITGYKTLDAGMGIGNSSGTTSDSIIFNTAQTYTGPSIRGRGQTLYRDYYLSNYEIADAGNYADVIPGSWTEIKSTENTITSGTATTSVTVSGSLASDDIIAIEFHTVDTEGTYSTSIQFVKLGSASSSLYSVVMFPSYNSGTTMRISFARVWLASSTSVSFSYSYYGEIDTTPTAQVDTVVVGKIWKINGVTGV